MESARPHPGLDPDTLELALEAIRAFASRHLPEDLLVALDSDHEGLLDVVRRMGEELGVGSLFLPVALGGMGAASFDIYRVCETRAGIDLQVATSVLAAVLGDDLVPEGLRSSPWRKARWAPW